jgi:hypothetical protein
VTWALLVADAGAVGPGILAAMTAVRDDAHDGVPQPDLETLEIVSEAGAEPGALIGGPLKAAAGGR